jgi:two-component system phosphate regulon sensor histidine kinase PhoR
LKNKAIRNIAILGSIAIAGVISVQIYWINQALNLQQKQFQEGVFISLKRVAERISAYNKMDSPATNTVKQISSDYYIANVREAIDANILKLYLSDEFDKMNVRVKKWSTESMFHFKKIKPKYVLENSQNTTILSIILV